LGTGFEAARAFLKENQKTATEIVQKIKEAAAKPPAEV